MTPDYPTPEERWACYEYLTERSVEAEGGCIEWTMAQQQGYGVCRYQGDLWRVHRLAFHYLVGYLPKSTVVHHRCGNRACWNPEHLQSVSHHANTAEMLGRVFYEEELALLRDEIEALRLELAKYRGA
jgi:hypothetical protein